MSVASIADRMVQQVMIDSGLKRPEAERVVAREVGLSPYTIESLRRDRLKNVDGISRKIDAALIRRLETQIVQLQHELEMARLRAHRPDADEILDAQTALEKARKVLERVR